MTDYAFSSTAACPMPPVPIIDVDLIKDCEVPPPADPIYEEPNLPMPVPPELDIGCPPIAVVTNVRKNRPEPRFDVKVKPQFDDGDYCFPRFFFNIDFPRSGGIGCFSIKRIGSGEAVTDIDRVFVDCETGSEVPEDEGDGIKLKVYYGSLGSCEITSSLGPWTRGWAVSSISSLTKTWKAFEDTCLKFRGLERLIYSGAEGKLFAYYRVFEFDQRGKLNKVNKEKREFSYGIYPPIFKATYVSTTAGVVKGKRLHSDGSIYPDDPEVTFDLIPVSGF